MLENVRWMSLLVAFLCKSEVDKWEWRPVKAKRPHPFYWPIGQWLSDGLHFLQTVVGLLKSCIHSKQALLLEFHGKILLFSSAKFKIFVNSLGCYGNIIEECSVRFTISFHAHCAQIQRVNQILVVLSTASDIFFIHDIFYLDARALERIRSCVAIFILVAVYSVQMKAGMNQKRWML